MTTLVAWTCSTAALTALDWAVAREYRLDRHVILCHVSPVGEANPLSQAALDDLVGRLHQDREGIRFTAELLHGDRVEQLERRCADGTLLVVGTDTRNEHPRRFERSLGMTLTCRGNRAVVVVPIDARHGAPSVCVGVDGSPASLAALRFAAAEADARSEPLVVVRSWHLRPVDEDSMSCTPERAEREIGVHRAQVVRLVEPIREQYPHLHVEYRFAHGETVPGLLAAAATAGLLVLGADDPDARNHRGETVDHAVVLRLHTAVAVVPA